MSTMEQQHYRQQATMSTAHHTNGHHYGQRRASNNVVDKTVTQTARDYAHTQGQNVSSAPNTCYAPYHRDIHGCPHIIYHGYGNISSHNQPPPMEHHFVHKEYPPHYQHSGHYLPTAHTIRPSNRSVSSYIINMQSSSCRVTTHCSSTGRHTPSQFHSIPLNLQSYIPEAA